jgi:hypothetical protein
MLSWLRQNIYTVHAVSDVLVGPSAPDRVEVGQTAEWVFTGPGRSVPLDIYLPPDATWQDAWSVTDYALDVLDSTVRQDGRQFAVFVIPDRRQVYESAWQATLAGLPDLDPANMDRERPTRTLLGLLRARNIPTLDLLEPFRASDEQLYFEIDGHFNTAGHRLTAEWLAGWLREARLVPVKNPS